MFPKDYAVAHQLINNFMKTHVPIGFRLFVLANLKCLFDKKYKLFITKSTPFGIVSDRLCAHCRLFKMF